MFQKIKLYIVSLWFLFLLLFVVKVNIPICFDGKCEFIGFKALILTNGIPLFALIFMILGAFFYFGFNSSITKGATLLSKKITSIKNLNSETLSFLATYIIPLACLDMDKSRSLPMLVLLLILIGWIYVRTNLFYTNPTLAIMGFKVYQLDTELTKDIIVITKQSLKNGDAILPRPINDNIHYAKKSVL
jgi:hypothetical protein